MMYESILLYQKSLKFYKVTINKELKALTGYDPYIAFQGDFRTASTNSTPSKPTKPISTVTLPSLTKPTLSIQQETTQTQLEASTPTASPSPAIAVAAEEATQTTTIALTPGKDNETYITLAMRSTSTTIHTKEIKTAITKIAFQQWRIITQDIMIKEAELKITQAAAAATTSQTIPTASASTVSKSLLQLAPNAKTFFPGLPSAVQPPT
jgi:hypothetical protein